MNLKHLSAQGKLQSNMFYDMAQKQLLIFHLNQKKIEKQTLAHDHEYLIKVAQK